MLKSITIGDRRLFVFPTLKGLVKERKEVQEVFRTVKPDALGVSLSDRELAEVRLVIQTGSEEVVEQYIPESQRNEEGEEEDEENEEEDDDDDEEDDEGEEEDEDGEDEDFIETPAGVFPRERVDEVLAEPFHPDLVAADSAASSDQIFISDTDMTFSRKLAAFGEVELPPPSFIEAVRAADRRGVPVEAVDLTELEYTDIFCDHVTYWQLVKHSRLVRKMRKRLRARGPEELYLEWDRRVRAIPGINVVEGERERAMAARLSELLDRHERVLAVIDLPRVDGVLSRLADLLGYKA